MAKFGKIIIGIFLVIGMVAYGFWSTQRKEIAQSIQSPTPTPKVVSRFTDILPFPSAIPITSANPNINFAQTGNLVKSGKFDWFLVYGKTGSAKNRVKLNVADKSLCQKETLTDYCIFFEFAAGDLVSVDGREKDGVVTVIKMLLPSGSANQAGLANPASVYCEEQGGKIEIVTQKDGSQSGLCRVSKTNACDEWEYYRTGVCK